MIGPTLPLVQGTSRDFQLQATPVSGVAYSLTNPSPFLGTDVLATKVWIGRARPALVTPTTSWVDAVSAKFQVSFNNADTLGFTAGRYRIQTSVARLGRTAMILDGWLEITWAPGVETNPLAFTRYEDLLQYATWLDGLQTDHDEEAFIDHQGRATDRLIDMLVQQWRPDWSSSDVGGSMRLSGGFGTVASPSNWFRQQLIPLVPGSVVPSSMPDRVSPLGTIANHVDPTVSTALLLYGEVKEIVAKLAIAYVCEQQIGIGGSGKTYQELAHRYKKEALSLYRARSFEFDMGNPQTGYASFVIHGGLTNIR